MTIDTASSLDWGVPTRRVG